jgi:hypothetical protein
VQIAAKAGPPDGDTGRGTRLLLLFTALPCLLELILDLVDASLGAIVVLSG